MYSNHPYYLSLNISFAIDRLQKTIISTTFTCEMHKTVVYSLSVPNDSMLWLWTAQV